VTWSKFYTEDLQTLDATAQNLVAMATWDLCTIGQQYVVLHQWLGKEQSTQLSFKYDKVIYSVKHNTYIVINT